MAWSRPADRRRRPGWPRRRDRRPRPRPDGQGARRQKAAARQGLRRRPDARRPPASRSLGVELPENGTSTAFPTTRGAAGRRPLPEGVAGAGIRRLDLHQALARRAERVGVELAWGVKADRPGRRRGGHRRRRGARPFRGRRRRAPLESPRMVGPRRAASPLEAFRSAPPFRGGALERPGGSALGKRSRGLRHPGG